MKYTILFFALLCYNISVAQQEIDSLIVFENTITAYDSIYSAPYSPQITQAPQHGTISWQGSTNQLGVVGQNKLFYKPDVNFVGADTLEIGYWKQSSFGPIFTKRLLFLDIVSPHISCFTIFQNEVLEYTAIYSEPYSPQITIFPSHGTASWLGSTNSVGVVGENILFYTPYTDLLGMDTLEIGYWKHSNFGPVFTKRLVCVEVISLRNTVKGSIFFDSNNNCQLDASEEDVQGWLLKVSNGEHDFYTRSNKKGLFELSLEDGDYIIEVILPNRNWAVCENNVELSLYDGIVEVTHFAAQATQLSPFLEVDISTSVLEACQANFYQISYCNKGTSIVEDAYIEVQLDPLLEFSGASIDFSHLLGNFYTFPLGNLDPDSCGDFQIYFTVSCESEAGQSHCSEAQIFPRQYFDWEGPIIEVNSQCEGDSVSFSIKNISEIDMPQVSNFIVIEDQVVYLQDNFILNSGDSLIIKHEANGQMIRLEAHQLNGFPYASFPSASIEGCSNDDDDYISRGVLQQYPEDDYEPFKSMDCRETMIAPLSHALLTFPTGYGDEHLITSTTELEYVLIFQNTSTDTVTQVLIKDFISPHLDLTTLQFGASSHPYHFAVTASNILEFSFDDILLPPQSTHEMASCGFLKFRISQQAFNPVNTVIRNHAAVSFDGESETSLKPVFHTVKEKFIRLPKRNPIAPPKMKPSAMVSKAWSVYPNPVLDKVFFDIPQETEAMKTIELFDMQGRLVANYEMSNTPFAVSLAHLKEGIYFYKINIDGEVVWDKLVVQY